MMVSGIVMNKGELRKIIEGSPFGEHTEKLMGQTQQAIRLHTEWTTMDDLPIGASRMGGLPDLRPDTPWPEVDGRPIEFLFQINFAEAAAVNPLPGFPDTGWLVVFFDIVANTNGHDIWRGLFFDTEPDTLRRVAPNDKNPRGLRVWGIENACEETDFHPCAITMEAWTCPPHTDAYVSLGIYDDEEVCDELIEKIDNWVGTPYHLLGGVPDEVQGDPRDGSDGHLLLQIDSDEEGPGWQWGDMGRMYFVATEACLAARDFSQIEASWDCY